MIADSSIIFPDPLDLPGNMVACGGDLLPGTLLAAYRKGIFPWFADNEPIQWWSLDPRFVIVLPQIHISRSLKKRIRQGGFKLSVDTAFEAVIGGCRMANRFGQDDTWITKDMEAAYTRLHHEGYAHSVEAWMGKELVGGAYGISLGACYFGESMFHQITDASKVAFTALLGTLIDADFALVDCQQHTRHLGTFGAVDMPKKYFLGELSKELEKPTLRGDWTKLFPEFPNSVLWDRITMENGI